MAKKVKTRLKLRIQAGQATPAPPVGPILGQHGLNLQEFCTKFNDATKDKMGDLIPVELTVYDDRTYDFVLKTPPASLLLKRAARIEKGSGEVPRRKAGKVTKAQIQEIATRKMENLNANTPEAATKIIEGTARSMGLDVE